LNNKRRHEVIEVAKNLIEKCCYFKVENFVIEDLNFKNSKNLGTNLNRLCRNQWIRNDFINNLKKRCKIFYINFMEVLPQYSSFVGNIMFRSLNLPDMVLSSIELSRRGYEFRHQYILKDRPQSKNIVKIDINDCVFKELFRESMEEFSVEVSFKDVIDAYHHFKRDSKLLYRVSLDSTINKTNRDFRDFLSRRSRTQNIQF
jgi:IS605 OrfB family transposase